MHPRGLVATGPPKAPVVLLILRIVVLVLSLAVFIAACYNVSTLDRINTRDGSGPGGLAIFTCIFTWIYLGLDIAFGMVLHRFYYRIAFLVVGVLAVIFWLSSWAYAASAASQVLGFCPNVRECKEYGGSAAAIAALGALAWLALLGIVVFFVVLCLRDGKASSPDAGVSSELGSVKPEAAPQHYPPEQYPPAQQPGYGPQSYGSGSPAPDHQPHAQPGYPEQSQGPYPQQQPPHSQPGQAPYPQ